MNAPSSVLLSHRNIAPLHYFKSTFIKKLNLIKEKLNLKKIHYKNLLYKNAKPPKPYIQNVSDLWK